MENKKPYMVKQTITFSDGTETVINYRGVIENGVLLSEEPVVEVTEENMYQVLAGLPEGMTIPLFAVRSYPDSN